MKSVCACKRAVSLLYKQGLRDKTTSAGSGNHFITLDTRRGPLNSPLCSRAKAYPCFITVVPIGGVSMCVCVCLFFGGGYVAMILAFAFFYILLESGL